MSLKKVTLPLSYFIFVNLKSFWNQGKQNRLFIVFKKAKQYFFHHFEQLDTQESQECPKLELVESTDGLENTVLECCINIQSPIGKTNAKINFREAVFQRGLNLHSL